MNNKEILLNKEELKLNYNKYKPVLQSILSCIETRLKSILTMESVPSFKARVKSFNSFYQKLLRIQPPSLGTQEMPVLTDLIGIRIICPFLEDLTIVEKHLVKAFNIVEIERKGAERTFSEFGYESIHILLEIPEEVKNQVESENPELKVPAGLVCEIQVRTILQDAWAEVEHELVYKSEFSPFDLPLRRKLASTNASLSLADIIFQEIRDYQNKLNRELAFRRTNFYEKADILSHQKIDNESLIFEDNSSEAENEIINPNMQYVHGTIDDMILEAIHAHNAGELDKAVNIYSQILNANPNDIVKSVIYKHRGMAYFAQNKYQEALGDFTKSVEKDSKNFRGLYYIGIVYSLQDEDEKAIEYFSKSLEINEYQSHVYYRKALSEYHLCRFSEAMADLKKAINLGLENDDVQKLYENLSAKIELQF